MGNNQNEKYLVSDPETLLHLAKIIIELLQEDTNQQLKLPKIVEILKDKLDSLNGTD